MTAMYANDTFVVILPGGSQELIVEGSLHDSTSPAAVAAPAKFTATAPQVGKGHMDPKLFGYLNVYPAGPEVK